MAVRKSTRIWWIILGAGVALCIVPPILGLEKAGDVTAPIGILLILAAVGVLGWRTLTWLARKLFYRLSWRLAFSYFLIGVFPIPLLALVLALAGYIGIGQFEAFRVEQALNRIGAEMASGELTGTGHAFIARGVVERSEVPGLASGSAAPSWLVSLQSPHLLLTGGAIALASAHRREEGVDLFTHPINDLFLAWIAERSGVAVTLLAQNANLEEKRGGVQINVKDSEGNTARKSGASFVYPPEALADDKAASPFNAVTWALVTTPLGAAKERDGGTSVVVIATRISWRRAFADLFGHTVIQGSRGSWALRVLFVVSGILLATYLVAVLVAFLLVLTMTRTVNRLSRATRKIGAGDFTVRIATRARDQVGDLARSFDSMAASLESTVRDRADKEMLDREIDQARMIAQRLLPPADARLPGLNTSAFNEPYAQMGGDYYDFLTTPEGCAAVAIGDVSGHGLPTALLVAAAKAGMETLLNSGESGSDLFAKLNGLLHRSTDARNYMTLALAVIPDNSRVRLTSAGHPPVYRISGAEVSALELHAFPLGLFPSRDFPTRDFPFRPGDRLVFYTDGIIECRNAADDAFGFDRFEDTLRANSSLPIDRLKKAVLDAVAAHCAGVEFDDDRTLVIVERA